MSDPLEELKSVTHVLNKEGIPYALCGGLAYSIYVEFRNTVDIDLLIVSQDFDRVEKALAALGFQKLSQRMDFKDLSIERLVKIFPAENDVIMIDFLLADTLEDKGIWEDRKIIHWQGQEIGIVSPQGLINLKEMRNSDQDLVDIKKIMEKGLT